MNDGGTPIFATSGYGSVTVPVSVSVSAACRPPDGLHAASTPSRVTRNGMANPSPSDYPDGEGAASGHRCGHPAPRKVFVAAIGVRMHPAALLLLLSACVVDNGLQGKDANPGFDPGDSATPPDTDTTDTDPPPAEECNGVDDDGDGQIDEDFPDENGNGRADCEDVECPTLDLGVAGTVPILEACAGTDAGTVTDPWNVGIEWQYTSAGSGVVVMPAVGNLTDDNGDGQVDEDDMPDIAFTTYGASTLVALNGDGSGEIFEVSGFDGLCGVTIADVTGDGYPEIIATTVGHAVVAVDATGATLWTSAVFGSMSGYPQPTVADLDNDGDVEVIYDVAVVNGADGTTVATLANTSTSYRTPIAADLDQDGQQEIILGNAVYDATGRLLWTDGVTGIGDFGAVGDVDGDPEGELFSVTAGVGYLHDADGTLLGSFVIPGGGNPGPPAIADFDGDGEIELAVPSGALISVFETDGTLVWSATMQDNSGLAGCSGYDVDGDGAYEVLFADEVAFRIYDGATGTVRYENRNHSSGTLWEYPVTADVDGDGSAEIVVADNSGAWQGITVYGHNGDGWPRSGTTWATHDFAVTNIEPDGHVPSPPEASWQVYNVFRARPSVDDPSSPDLYVNIDDICVADCTWGPVALTVQVHNQGGVSVSAGTMLAVYADDNAPRLVATVALPEIASGTSLAGIQVDLTPADIGAYGFIVTVDDDGTGLGDVDECDELNNTDRYTDVFCP